MISRIHQKLGTAGFIISIVAMVAAVSGGAYAAKGGLTGKQKKEVQKIAKRYAGKPGKNGAPGPTGPAGKDGSNGKAGSNGTNGTNGESVNIAAAGGSECTSGGTKFSNGTGSGHVCNGQTGFTETLPAGKTETGTWAIGESVTTEGFEPPIEISFPIPLAAAGVNKAFAFGEEETIEEEFGSSGCTGSVTQPTAPAGALCVYTAFESISHTVVVSPRELRIPGSGGEAGYGVSGSTLRAFVMEGSTLHPATVEAEGTWAVTAPGS